ncbi:MAG: MerR family transcriptional regulator [Clostridia bacterium]|nr:MerR family transcriptional regulator [Clostridia bacterium]MBQ8511729.1 MerR family transcriptional regulator [Clostridia bacterium]
MKIKEAAERTGLTEKAIRLYEEKGLIAPPVTEINGRKFRDYDEDTMTELNTIAGLRRSFFSLEQIAKMQENPDEIPAVFDEYLRVLREQYVKLGDILDRAESLTADHMTDAASLSAAMTAPVMELPAEDAPQKKRRTVVELRFRIWDEDVTKDQRDAAYQRYLAYSARWEKRYGWELAFGKIFGFIGRHRRWFIGALCLAVVYLIAANACFVKEYSRTFTGYRIAKHPETGRYDYYPNDGEPVTLTLNGTLHRYWLRTDYFTGEIHLDGFEPESAYYAKETLTNDYYFQYGFNSEGGYWHSVINANGNFSYLTDEHGSTIWMLYSNIGGRDEFLCFEIDNEEIRHGDEYAYLEYFIFPADSPEEATELHEKWIKSRGKPSWFNERGEISE